jgi:cytochrome P450
VPFADREYFSGLSDRVATFGIGGDTAATLAEFHGYIRGLADAKRAEPGEDVVSDMARTRADDPTCRWRRSRCATTA